MSLIQKYILPKEIDFNAALIKQVTASKNSVLDLCKYCQTQNLAALKTIIDDEHNSHHLRRENVHKLLDVFITPYDKEAIYRLIIQLDWLSLSVKHLCIDLLAYKIHCPDFYHNIFNNLSTMVNALANAFEHLPKKELEAIFLHVESIHDNYDKTVKECALATLQHLENDEIKSYLAHKEVLNQLKEIARRIHICANYLEDMAMKVV